MRICLEGIDQIVIHCSNSARDAYMDPLMDAEPHTKLQWWGMFYFPAARDVPSVPCLSCVSFSCCSLSPLLCAPLVRPIPKHIVPSLDQGYGPCEEGALAFWPHHFLSLKQSSEELFCPLEESQMYPRVHMSFPNRPKNTPHTHTHTISSRENCTMRGKQQLLLNMHYSPDHIGHGACGNWGETVTHIWPLHRMETPDPTCITCNVWAVGPGLPYVTCALKSPVSCCLCVVRIIES